MPRKILATVIECWCCDCGKQINIRLSEGEEDHTVSCLNCDATIVAHNGYGTNNIHVTCDGSRIRYLIIWQQKP